MLYDFSHRHHVLAPGVGYGKTTFGPLWMHIRILMNAMPFKYGVLGPTNRLAKECFDAYENFLRCIGWVENVHYKIKRSPGEMELQYPNGARIYGVTAKNYKTIVSYTFAGVWCDEPGHLGEEVWSEIIKRNRQGGAKVLQSLRTGVPQGHGESAYFKQCTGEAYRDFGSYNVEGEGSFVRWRSDGMRLIMHGSTHENWVNDESYIENLRDDFGWSSALWDQQVHGIFIGAVTDSLYDFDRKTHLGFYPPDPEIGTRYLTFDFNVGQTSWLNIERRGRGHYVVDESCSNRDTQAACESFRRKFPPDIYGGHEILVTGDSTAYKGDTRANADDFKIIKDALKGDYPFLKVVTPKSNPLVSHSIIATNRLMNDNPKTGEKSRLFVNNKCVKLTGSFLSTEPDGRGGIKKPTGDTWTHPADGFRYYVNLVEPLRRNRVTGGTL